MLATPIDRNSAEMPDAPWLDDVLAKVAAVMAEPADVEPTSSPIERRFLEAISILRDAAQAFAITADLIHMRAMRGQPVQLSNLEFLVLDSQVANAGFTAKFLAGKL